MSIRIKRNTGWYGSGSQIHITINGEKVASIGEKQNIEVNIPNDIARLRVAHYGIKSNEIEVKDGDNIEIASTRWYRMTFPLSIGIPFFSIFLPTLLHRLIAIIVLGILLIASTKLINGFYLKTVTQGHDTGTGVMSPTPEGGRKSS